MKKPVVIVDKQQELEEQTVPGQPYHEQMNKTANYVSRYLPSFITFDEPFSPSGLLALNEIPIFQQDILKGQIDRGVSDVNARNSDIFFLSDLDQYGWVYEMVKEVIIKANKDYDFNLWTIETIQYSIYKEGQFYATHTDIDTETRGGMRKLSFSIQLTDPEEYEGGDLVFHYSYSDLYAPRKKGSMTVFASFTPHEVTRVTKGTRRALVGWILGPDFA